MNPSNRHASRVHRHFFDGFRAGDPQVIPWGGPVGGRCGTDHQPLALMDYSAELQQAALKAAMTWTADDQQNWHGVKVALSRGITRARARAGVEPCFSPRAVGSRDTISFLTP